MAQVGTSGTGTSSIVVQSLCHGTRKGLHRGYMTCAIIGHKESSLLTSPSSNGSGLVQPACLSHWDKHNLFQYACPTGTGCACPTVVLVPLGQAQPVPIYLSHWDRLCLSKLLAPVGQVWYRHHPSKVCPSPMLGSFLIKNQRGPNQISKFLIKNRYQIGPKSRQKIDIFSLFL